MRERKDVRNMKMTLYEIEQALLECVDSETGEILDFEKLDELQMARETKIENIALYIKDLNATASAIKAEEKALAERRKAKENRAESLKEYLNHILNGSAFETAKVKLSYRASKSVLVTDEIGLVHWLEDNGKEECLAYSLPRVNKTEVSKLLKEGAEIPGAVLQENNNLQIK